MHKQSSHLSIFLIKIIFENNKVMTLLMIYVSPCELITL
ncbi:hypothetical protein VHARVF571_550058 [Vibrio harveyi]|nr:hypothetical protein VHARVF571_550058 [Vibrio harveyi]